MADWHYIRLTGKKGDSGSELMAKYSVQNSIRPEDDDPTNPLWHETCTASDYYMCTKVNDEEHSWGTIVKIRAEQLEIQYSVNGTGNPDTSASNWHYPYTSGDKYIIQKMENGSWGSALKFIGEDGENGANAVVITGLNPPNPAGSYDKEVGNYNGVLYQWNSTTNKWDRMDAVTNTELSTSASTTLNSAKDYADTKKAEAISSANANVSTYTPRYIGAFPSSSAPSASNYNAGDGYLNTSNSKLYIKVGSAWSEQSSVTESNRNMYNLAMKDMLNLAGATGTVAEYATAFVENLFADKATINELQSMSVLFKDYCGSIMSQNPNIGDTMIYMGKNPRLSSVTREFQFAISEYLGKVGQQEMWSDKLITKILASGILALSVMGCVQATDGVYSGIEKYWQETNYYDESMQQAERTNVVTGILHIGNVTYLITLEGNLYKTEDNENYSYIRQLPFHNYGVITKYNNEIYIGSENGVYKTSDMANFQKVLETNTTVQEIYLWKNKNKLVVTEIDAKVHYSNNGSDWNTINWDVDSILYFNDDFCCANFSNQYYEYTEDFLQIKQKINPCYSQNMGYISVFEKDNSFLLLSQVKLYSISSDLENNTLIANNLNITSIKRSYYHNGICYCEGEYLKKINLDGTQKTIHQYGAYEFEPNLLTYDNYIVHYSTNGKIYISFDEKKWKDIKLSNNYINSGHHSLRAIVEYDGWFYCFTEEAPLGGNSYQHLYISRGREAGSGIIDESFGTEQNYTLNSNGQLMQWGKQTFNRNVDGGNNVAGTAITFPKEFKSEPVVSVTHFNGNQFNMTVRDVSTTGFTPVYRNVNNTSNANTQGCYWIAIGT